MPNTDDSDKTNPAGLDGLDEQLINQLVSRAKAGGLQLTGEGGVLQHLTKRLLDSALDGEITEDRVLAAYADQHLDTADLAIEMPTGEGKTLLALLIANHALSRGWSVAYLTGTRQLAERVEEEAEDLGLDVVRFAAKDYGGAKLDDYHQAQAVGVMNYWVYSPSATNAKPTTSWPSSPSPPPSPASKLVCTPVRRCAFLDR